MADDNHLAILRRGVDVWNTWRKADRLTQADLSRANLQGQFLHNIDLYRANLQEANLARARLQGADLRMADLQGARLSWVDLLNANLSWANLQGAYLDFAGCQDANFSEANLRQADLHAANLARAQLVETCLEGADLRGCAVYGVSTWNVQTEGARQAELIINRAGEPTITVDNLKLAQFIYLILDNHEIREVIDTVTSKVVLILGRFTPERKAVLDALRDALRQQNYVPVLFDFDGPASRNTTETVTLLARMARFIIADLTEPSSLPLELEAIVPDVAVPVQPLIVQDDKPFSMLGSLYVFPWMLPVYRYADQDALLATLHERVIAPAEAKVGEVRTLKLRQADTE